MRRRAFITLLGGAAAASTWPLAARAQQSPMPVIGFLDASSPEGLAPMLAMFRQGLKEAGFTEGQNFMMEYRSARFQRDRLPGLAAELVGRRVAVIAAGGGDAAAFVAKAATSTIPIVFQGAFDPVKSGLVVALNRPGGNVTGVTNVSAELEAKRLGLLHELAPAATTIALLVDANNIDFESAVADVQAAGRILGKTIVVAKIGQQSDLEAGFAAVLRQGAGAILVSAGAVMTQSRAQIIALADRHRVPAISARGEYARAGGLMSYGTDLADSYRQAGLYAARILKGEKPADLPILQPTKFELVFNLKAARALGLTVPPMLLALANEVIE